MTDQEAREILRKWPIRPKRLWDVPGTTARWLRAWPKEVSDQTKSVVLGPPGADHYRTRPDGLWISCTVAGLVDAFVIEQSGTIQNLNDKRSRYGASTSSVIAYCPAEWLNGSLTKRVTRAQYLGMASPVPGDVPLPVRHLRALYVIPDEDYNKWATTSAPGAHEFFCRHSSLGSYNSQTMQTFLKRMSPSAQFYTAPTPNGAD